MKVILQQDVKGQGKKGQMIEVSEGYGRNFLIPRKLAVAATADNMNVMRQAEEAQARRVALEQQAAREYAQKFEDITVHITAKSGTGGRLFGSVTSKEVASQLKKEHGIDIPKQKIVMKESIKSFGTFVLKVKLYPEITGNLKVQVTEE
ncbi:MAG: 50S ribosomal protein L9 [Butyricicoccaceae bacterium]